MNVIKYWLVLAVLLLPWFVGGTTPFARSVLLGCLAVWLAAIAIAQLTSKSGRGLPLLGWVLVAGLLATVLQVTPIDSRIQQALNVPTPVQSERTDLAESDDDRMAESQVARSTVSVYPPATRQKLVELIAAVGVFFVATVLLRRRADITLLMGTLVVCGVGLSSFGIVQKLSWNGKLFWVFDLVEGGVPFGSYVNSNNCAGFLLITLSAAMYFVFYQVDIWDRPSKRSSELNIGPEEWSQKPKRSILQTFGRVIARMKPLHLYFFGAIATIVAGVVLTLSRGGMVAMGCCLAVGFIFLVRMNRIAGVAIVAGVILVGLMLVQYADQSLEVQREVSSLGDLPGAAAVRLDHWGDAVEFSRDHWLVGVGNGTYRFVSSTFQSFPTKRLFAHAESVYVETLVEMGVLGLALLALVVFMVGGHIRLLLKSNCEFDRAVGNAGLVCLAGQAVAAAFDFGIYQPGNYVALATFLGCVVGRSVYLQQADAKFTTSDKLLLGSKLAAAVTLVILVGASVWGAYESYGVDMARSSRHELRLMDRKAIETGRLPSSLRLDSIEARLRSSLKIRPDDSLAHYYLGEAYVYRERINRAKQTKQKVSEQISELESQMREIPEEESSSETIERRSVLAEQIEALKNVSSAEIWMSTELLAMHQQFRLQERTGKAVINPESSLHSAWDHFESAERLCSRRPQTQLRLAQLAAMVGKDCDPALGLSETQRIELALRRTIPDAQLHFNAGFLMLSSGEQGAAAAQWQQCLAGVREKVHEKAIIQQCMNEMSMRLFYESVLPQDPSYLIKLARLYFGSPEMMIPRRYLASHIEKLILDDGERTELGRTVLLGELAVLSEDYENVSVYYSKLDSLEHPSGPWRCDYAVALISLNQFDEATRQLKICQIENLVPLSKVQRLMVQIRRQRYSRPLKN